jgi:cobalt-zinc-cadmium efflux system outer membrane protein
MDSRDTYRADRREEHRLDPAARRRSPAVTCVGRGVDAIVAAVILCVIGGCAHYIAKPLAPEKTLATFEARRVDDAAVRARVALLFPILATDWPPARWDRAHLFALAVAANPELAVSRAEVDASVVQRAHAGLLADPDLSLQTEYARAEEKPWLYGLGLSIPLPSGARRELDRQIADTEVDTARATMLAQVWQVRSDIAHALSDLEFATRQRALLDALQTLQQQRVDTSTTRVTAGEADAGDSLTAREALLRAQAARADADRAVSRAEAALAQALGLPAAAITGLPRDWADWGAPPTIDDATVSHRREQALLARADLAAAIATYAGSERRLQRAIARQYPTFVLSPGYYWDHGIAKWPLSLAFALPLFNGNRGEIAEADAAREVAGAKLIAAQTRIHGEIDAAARVETIAIANLSAADRQVASAAEQQRRQQLALKLGAIDRVESLATDILAGEAALDALQRRADLQNARLAREDALHAPLSGPELALPPAPATTGDVR